MYRLLFAGSRSELERFKLRRAETGVTSIIGLTFG